MTVRPLFLPFLALLLAAANLAQGPTLRIGTWNLEFLGAEGNFRQNLPGRDEADFRKLGQKVKELGVAVLAVQEICGEAPLQKVAAAAGPSWRTVLGTTGSWDDGKTSQQIGFLYDSAVVDLVFAEELLGFPREAEGVPIFHRVPVTAVFRCKATGFDFRAVTVHLKAGQKKQDEQKRRLEATVLHGWFAELQQRAGEDEDRVLLGDFNSTYGSEPEAIFETGGLLTYLDQKAPTIMHFAEPIDQVAVAPGLDEVRRATFTVHSDYGGLDKTAWRKIYSDHFPVTVEIATAKDGDPDATFWRGDAAFVLPAAQRQAVAVATTAPSTRTTKVTPWPPAIGSRISVRCGPMQANGQPTLVVGTLRAELPQGPGGWVLLEVEGGLRAIPYAQVFSLEPQQ